MTSVSPFFPSTGQISNRGFIKRLEQWGWFAAKRKGDHWTMESPNGDRVTVCAPQIKQGNPASTFNEVVHIMGIDWQTFIDPLAMEHRLSQVEKNYRAAIQEAYDFVKKEIRSDEDRKRMAKEREARRKERDRIRNEKAVQEAAERAQRRAQQQQDEEPTTPEASKEDAPVAVKRKTIKKIISKDEYLDALRQLGGEAKATDIAVVVGIDTDDKADVQRVYSMMYDLMRKGKVIKSAPGLYKVLDKKPEPEAEVEVSPTPIKPTASVGTQDVQDLLDMLFPDGFKARHLPAIQTWMKATTDLIEEVQGGTVRQ